MVSGQQHNVLIVRNAKDMAPDKGAGFQVERHGDLEMSGFFDQLRPR